MALAKRTVVRGAQLLLRESSPGLSVDGSWGPKTDHAYTSAPELIQDRVENYAKQSGWSVDTLRRKTEASGVWISAAAAHAIAREASAKAGIDAEVLDFFLTKEPNSRKTVSGIEYQVDSRSKSGLYYGLFQMGEDAWTDAQRVFPEIGDFSNWKDPRANALAAAGFAIANMRYARVNHGYRGAFSKELLYAMHNQGHSFIRSARAGGAGYWYDGQSASAKAVLRTAAQQLA